MMISPAICPICRKPLVRADGSLPETVPFCSQRCQQVDLYRWFSGKYAIVEDLPPERLIEEITKTDEQPEAGE